MSLTLAVTELAGIIETAGYSWGVPESDKSYVLDVKNHSGPVDVVNDFETIQIAVVASADVGMRWTRANYVSAVQDIVNLRQSIRAGLLTSTEIHSFDVGELAFELYENVVNGALSVSLTY